MSVISQYESLKKDGTSIDRIKLILSLKDKNEIEEYLKKSSTTSYTDLQTLIFLANLTKNERNLLEIFEQESLPIKQRAFAGRSWIDLQNDEKAIENLVVQTINNPNAPRYLKNQILRCLHQVKLLKKSPSFFYELICRLTEKNNPEEYNLDAHLLPFCTRDQILNLLSRWSIESLKQIDSSSAFYSKLIKYQPSIIIHLIRGDLNQIKTNNEKFADYFQGKEEIIRLIYRKESREFLCLFVEYVKQLDKHQRYLPNLIQSNEKYFFNKCPNEMIELISIIASVQPGSIKTKTTWGSESNHRYLSFPRSFSIENYLKLFSTLSHWSSNHFLPLLELMLHEKDSKQNLYSIRKRRQWFFDILVEQQIGKDLFLQKLFKDANQTTLDLLDEFPELTTPLSIDLLNKSQRNGIVTAETRLTFIRYQLMNKDLFELFLSLFKQTGSNVNQRQINYPLFLQSALATNEEWTQHVLQWIEKRLINEQMIVIQHLIDFIASLNDYFHLKILPNHFQTMENIFHLALNHLQRSSSTSTSIINYGIFLFERIEFHSNEENIEQFATQIIKQSYSKVDIESFEISIPSKSYPKARKYLLNILLSDVFPRLIDKSMLNQLNNLISKFNDEKSKCLPEMDLFLTEFFTKTFPSSKKLRAAFDMEKHSSMIDLFLKNKSTRYERVNFLINQIDQIFFMDQNIQRIVLHSQQHRTLIDQLIEDEKSVTWEKISQGEFHLISSNSRRKNIKFPGLDLDVLSHSSQYLTEKQQEHITNIILNDYLQDVEVTNLNKLESLRILRRLTGTLNQTLQWIESKQESPLKSSSSDEKRSRHRGANAQSLDDIIICLPTTFDLTPDIFLKQFSILTGRLNTSNAKYISDALFNISRKIPDQIFLKNYFDFIRNEQFQQLGITPKKEILRLLIEFTSNANVISEYLKSLWDNHPHQDIRACLVLILLHFIGRKTNSNEDETILWNILHQAADDEYILVIQQLLGIKPGSSTRILNKLKVSSKLSFEKFVNEIQLQILDHPNSLQARSFAWTNIDHEHVDTNKFIEKAQQLCIQFDKDANTLWETAFGKIISLFKEQKISSIDILRNIIQKIMSRREEIDSKENGLDNKHDLPVYHRIQRLLNNLIASINQFNDQSKIHFRSLTQIIFQFDQTLSPQIGALLVKIAQNKEDLENILKFFQDNLPEYYFQRIGTHLAMLITKKDACPFVQQLNFDEKLQLAQWFIQDKNRPAFVFHLLKNDVFNQSGVDKTVCQNLIRQCRTNEDLFLRQQAMEYTVPWNEDGNVNDDDDDRQMGIAEDTYDSDMD